MGILSRYSLCLPLKQPPFSAGHTADCPAIVSRAGQFWAKWEPCSEELFFICQFGESISAGVILDGLHRLTGKAHRVGGGVP